MFDTVFFLHLIKMSDKLKFILCVSITMKDALLIHTHTKIHTLHLNYAGYFSSTFEYKENANNLMMRDARRDKS